MHGVGLQAKHDETSKQELVQRKALQALVLYSVKQRDKKKLRTVLGHHADSIMAWAATIQHAPRSTPYLTLFTFLQILSWTMRLVPGCCREGKVKANISSSATIKTEPKPTGHAPGAMRRIFAFSVFSFQLAASR